MLNLLRVHSGARTSLSSRLRLAWALPFAASFSACGQDDDRSGEFICPNPELMESNLGDGSRERSDRLVFRATSAPYLNMPKSAEIEQAGWDLKVAFSGINFDDPVMLLPLPGTNTLIVAEREGKLYAFENKPDVAEKKLVLDLSAVNQGEDDSGLLGVVFHPQFGQPGSPNEHAIFLQYAYTESPVIGEKPDSGMDTEARLSRFQMDVETLTIDPDSEEVLIAQLDQNVWHQGGALFFHPVDGFLYYAIGDEGSGNCGYDNCQIIDKDLFSGVIRIDVDQRGGDISHPIVNQPATGSTSGYYIPNDNPWVGVEGALEEFYAIGLRSPHRMTYDAIDDIAWIGDVGQGDHEELNVLAKGANFQWNLYEGLMRTEADDVDERLGLWTDPVVEFPRKDAQSIIGGYVYRGQLFPELEGKYIYGDFGNGVIWALSYNWDGEKVEVLENPRLLNSDFQGREDGITSFGLDSQGEIYVLTLGDEAQILTLDKRIEDNVNLPRKLSETGVLDDTASLTWSQGLLPYDVNAPLYSDGAVKTRFVSIPQGERATFSPQGAWAFPEGTIFVKHFEMALDETKPEQMTRLETRLLVHGKDDYYAVTYRWNESQTDATLLLESETSLIEKTQEDGSTFSFSYLYPSPDACMECHTKGAGRVLGPRTGQLNRVANYPELSCTANQLEVWQALELIDEVPSPIEELDRWARLGDEAYSLEDRVRSYWASNCSMCHGSVEGIKAEWDGRFETPLDEQGVVDEKPLGGSGKEEERLIAPGRPEDSLLLHRVSTTDAALSMPPLGRSTIDEDFVQTLNAWILELPAEPE